MALVIKDSSSVPPGGSYRLKSPISGSEFRHHTPDGVMRLYVEHCKANAYPVPSEQEMIEIICRSTPANICAGAGYEYKDRSLGMSDVLRGTRVLASFKLAGSPMVSQFEANRRAAICAGCPENVPYAKSCVSCTDVEQAVLALIGDVGTPSDAALQACFICGCSNRAQVWLEAEQLEKGVTESMKEQFKAVFRCWKGELFE